MLRFIGPLLFSKEPNEYITISYGLLQRENAKSVKNPGPPLQGGGAGKNCRFMQDVKIILHLQKMLQSIIDRKSFPCYHGHVTKRM